MILPGVTPIAWVEGPAPLATKSFAETCRALTLLRPTGVSVPAGDSDADHLAMQAALFGYLATGDADPLR
jgi:hypothetical protein